jgi:uncharacterized protein (DUF2384 family)
MSTTNINTPTANRPDVLIPVAGYQTEEAPDLSSSEVRKELSSAAIEGFFAICDQWGLTAEQRSALLGGMARSTMYKMKDERPTLGQDELTRISCIVGMYNALHMVFPERLANEWMLRPNSNSLFRGTIPLDFAIRTGIPGLLKVRNMLDALAAGNF